MGHGLMITEDIRSSALLNNLTKEEEKSVSRSPAPPQTTQSNGGTVATPGGEGEGRQEGDERENGPVGDSGEVGEEGKGETTASPDGESQEQSSGQQEIIDDTGELKAKKV